MKHFIVMMFVTNADGKLLWIWTVCQMKVTRVDVTPVSVRLEICAVPWLYDT